MVPNVSARLAGYDVWFFSVLAMAVVWGYVRFLSASAMAKAIANQTAWSAVWTQKGSRIGL